MEEKNSKKKERKMRDSGIPWIGEVPEGWGMSPLKYNYNILAGATPDSTKQNFWDGNIKWITPADYKTKDVYVSFGKRNLTSAGYKACSTHMLPKGSIVISKRAPIGSVAITTSDLCTNQGCLGLVAKNKFVNNKYFYYVLSIYDDVLNLYGSGTTFKEISANVFSNIEFPSPSVTIQNSIADFLDSKCSEIDTLIENLCARVESAKEYKKAVITEAVTKGLDKDAKMKDSGVEWIGEIPEGWKYAKAKYCIEIQNGSDPHLEGNIPVYGSGAKSFKTCGEYKNGPTVLIGRKGATLHIPHYIVGKFWNVDTAFNVYTKPHYLLKYYYYCAVSFDYKSYISQTTLPSMTQTNYENMVLPMPSLLEQQQIVSFLDYKCSEIDTLLQNYEDQISTLEEYKKSLIYEYVTGKKEVPAA